MRIDTLGGGYSLECGQFWATEDKIYWADGSVTDNRDDGGYHRLTFWGAKEDIAASIIDYSKWTPAERELVKQQAKAQWEADEAYYKQLEDERNALRASARLKLTEDEISACDLEDDYRR